MNTNTKARREYDLSMTSLINAERLVEILSAHTDEAAENGYLADAIKRAQELEDEMAYDLQDVMDRYSPEQLA